MPEVSYGRAARSIPAARVVSLLMCLLFCALSVHAADTGKPTGKNCALASPPAAAGETVNHGIILRVYPRNKDIDTRYSGCQVLFAPEGEKWIVLSLTEVMAGDPVRVWSDYETDAEVLACRFKQGKLVQGSSDTCPASRFILLESLAPGCTRLVQDAVAKYGLGAPRTPACEYQ
jgi:hypothetical protein